MADIELIIKIPEEEYKNICLMSKDGIGMALYDWIANGTPLPKNHGRLIDADALIESDCYWETEYEVTNAPIILSADKEDEE